MAGWHLSEQARQVLWTALDLARGRRALGSADPLLVAILERWDDERFGGPALLRACGMTAEQASRLATTLLPPEPAEAAVPDAEPRIIGTLRFVLDQADRIAAEARALCRHRARRAGPPAGRPAPGPGGRAHRRASRRAAGPADTRATAAPGSRG